MVITDDMTEIPGQLTVDVPIPKSHRKVDDFTVDWAQCFFVCSQCPDFGLGHWAAMLRGIRREATATKLITLGR